jgi:hypothetical protein
MAYSVPDTWHPIFYLAPATEVIIVLHLLGKECVVRTKWGLIGQIQIQIPVW